MNANRYYVITNLSSKVMTTHFTMYKLVQSNAHNWIAMGPDYEYPLRKSIHFHTLHRV